MIFLSLHSNSELDVNIKGAMIKDMLNIAGFRLPDERDISNSHTGTDPKYVCLTFKSIYYCYLLICYTDLFCVYLNTGLQFINKKKTA